MCGGGEWQDGWINEGRNRSALGSPSWTPRFSIQPSHGVQIYNINVCQHPRWKRKTSGGGGWTAASLYKLHNYGSRALCQVFRTHLAGFMTAGALSYPRCIFICGWGRGVYKLLWRVRLPRGQSFAAKCFIFRKTLVFILHELHLQERQEAALDDGWSHWQNQGNCTYSRSVELWFWALINQSWCFICSFKCHLKISED